MTKIYLQKNLTIVLSIISGLLAAVYFYYTITLYGISVVNKEALQDPGFKYKFFETVSYALIWLSACFYFIIKVVLNKPMLEVRYEDDFVYEEIIEEVSDEENNELDDESSDEDKK